MNKHYLIIGLGKTGQSCARFLQAHSLSFDIFDTRDNLDTYSVAQAFPNANIHLSDWKSIDLTQYTNLVLSPGISLSHPLIVKAQQTGITVEGDIELFAQCVKQPVIGVTGTNGKSTVVSLLGEIAKAAGISVAVGGNIGKPVLDLLQQTIDYELWVLELSSFQLETTNNLALAASIILNVSDDHMDRYVNLKHYAGAKQRIHQQSRLSLYNRQDRLTFPEILDNSASIGLDTPPSDRDWGLITINEKKFIAKGKRCLIDIGEVCIKGEHNYFNAMASAALADSVGIDFETIASALTSFRGLKHRCQNVRELNGVTWINDSKATNVGAAVSAIKGLAKDKKGQLLLIAGGQGKEADFTPLSEAICDHVQQVIVLGEDGLKIKNLLADNIDVVSVSSMEHAVIHAFKRAQPGDTVLLSPACASFDMFDNFEHRGDVFIQMVSGLNA